MKQDAMQKMNENYELYTDADHKIYSFIRNNSREIPDLTISELAIKTETSTSAITRFVRKNGYDRFVDFRIDIGKYLAKNPARKSSEVFTGSNLSVVSNSLLDYACASIESALHDDNQQIMNDFVDILVDADMVFVHGTGLSALAAESFYQKAIRYGLNVHLVTDIATAKFMMQKYQDQSCLLSISNSGLSEEVLSLINHAKKDGIKTVSLTQKGKNPISLATHLQLGNGETMSSTKIINSSVYAQLIIIDLIFIVYSNRKGIELEDRDWVINKQDL
ncbi:MurR/RpiR family transcriptional regulator [Erysipelothrix urinaevulpis]|uniref:MurR/RpiR family transcriptional regulator n=1 Tax=Erysipelothrix urinaevulpis TaxID=2683717 RepID=UPI001358AB57|nr:MurR/RpiR family transcriptional regulator [Erysipelothrix urinaevulpis]